MTIEKYIKSNSKFELMPFAAVYTTISELIKDGFIAPKMFEGGVSDVEVSQPKPEREGCWGLYDQGDFRSN